MISAIEAGIRLDEDAGVNNELSGVVDKIWKVEDAHKLTGIFVWTSRKRDHT